jgi:hypothetical protein
MQSSSIELQRVTGDGDRVDVPLSSSAQDLGLQTDSTVYMWAVMSENSGK